MKRIKRAIIVSLCGVVILTALADAQTSTTQPGLPAGHPDISTMTKQPAGSSGSLPAGHPDLSQLGKTPNSGEAGLPAMPPGVNLPAGHPDLSRKSGPATQRSELGTLTIRAIQGSSGAL